MKPTRLKVTDKELTPDDMAAAWQDILFGLLDGDVSRSVERKEMFQRFLKTFSERAKK